MIDKNIVSKIPPHELDARSGPVHRNTHQDVLKNSVTTPVYLVSNSLFPNGSTTLNELLVKGQIVMCVF